MAFAKYLAVWKAVWKTSYQTNLWKLSTPRPTSQQTQLYAINQTVPINKTLFITTLAHIIPVQGAHPRRTGEHAKTIGEHKTQTPKTFVILMSSHERHWERKQK